MLTKAQVTDLFKSKIHCSQIVLGEFAEELGYSREEAYKMANAFGGGCFRGDTCGAVAGAMIAIGLKYGNDEPGNIEAGTRFANRKSKNFSRNSPIAVKV